jgi:hypothetical protein
MAATNSDCKILKCFQRPLVLGRPAQKTCTCQYHVFNVRLYLKGQRKTMGLPTHGRGPQCQRVDSVGFASNAASALINGDATHHSNAGGICNLDSAEEQWSVLTPCFADEVIRGRG